MAQPASVVLQDTAREGLDRLMTVEEAAGHTIDIVTGRKVSPRTGISWIAKGDLVAQRPERSPRRRHVVNAGPYREYLQGKPYEWIEPEVDSAQVAQLLIRVAALEEQLQGLHAMLDSIHAAVNS